MSIIHTSRFVSQNLLLNVRRIPKAQYNPTMWKRTLTGSEQHKKTGSEQENTPSRKKTALIAANVVFFLVSAAYVIKKLIDKKSSEPEIWNDPHLNKDAQSFRYKDYWLPLVLLGGENTLKEIEDFEVRQSDVLVSSFPKSGTTWVQEIVFRILCQDEEQAQRTLEDRFPYLEFIYPGLRELSAMPSPRLMKTHLPLDLMPKDVMSGKGKVIYIARNPKDVSVSYYHFVRMLKYASYRGSFKTFFKTFIEGKVNYGPWPNHVLSYWSAREKENILFITYEELQEDLPNMIKKLADFLGVEVSEWRIEEIASHCTFQAMKTNKSTNYSWWDRAGLRHRKAEPFMRKGKVGDWKILYTDEMAGKVDQMCKDHLSTHGLTLKDEVKTS